MAHAGFVHLRCHSAYSLSEGAIRVGDLVKLAAKNAMPAVALTDSNNLFGALEFSKSAKDAGVQPILGCTLTVRDPMLEPGRALRAQLPVSVVLLSQTEEGYANLVKLVSLTYVRAEGAEPFATLEDLAAHADGLILLTGGLNGPVGRLLRDGQKANAEIMLRRLAELFPGRCYVELHRLGLPGEATVEGGLLDLAFAENLPLVATNRALFASEDLFEAHDALMCVAQQTVIEDPDRQRLTPDHRFRGAEEMRMLFADIPEAIDNTLVIARRCAVAAPFRKPILPRFGDDETAILRQQSAEGLAGRLATHVFAPGMTEAERAAAAQPYFDRLAFELGVIEKMNFPGYFLIVSDFIQWAKRHEIPVGPGRGSGAGSVVAWALSITDLDPLRFNLLFERFLNPERISMPDFDVDFCQDRRDEVIAYVQQKYGHEQVAQIITFGKLQARAVLRDVGRVMGVPYGRVDKLCKLVPNNPAKPVTLKEAINGEAKLQYERDSDPQIAKLMDIALKLEGLYRHASTHAAGVVIGDRPLDQLVPLYRDPKSDMLVTQFNMKWVEQAGLVKFDFLGLKTLTVLARAVKLLAERGIEVDLLRLPLDDAASYQMLGKGDTVGVFQLESSGMRSALVQLRADKFEDIIAMVALYRPGPMDNIPTYIKRKHGQEAPDYLHPLLEPVLTETYGVIIYQEQVMQIAQRLSGYSLGEADILRRAMGKKDVKEMAAQRARFVEGAARQEISAERASFLFDLVDKFAGYGFNKSHAAAYALVAYQTAYLKANYPVEFLAASMTYDMSNTDKLDVFRAELGRLKIPLLPPDINRSGVDFTVEANADGQLCVRYALAALKGVGRQAMESLVAERAANGLFADLFDFARRLEARQINKRQLEGLAAAGAFDGLNANRAQVHGAADILMRYAAMASEERQSQQNSLFGSAGNSELPTPDLPRPPSWSVLEKLEHEAASIGFFLSAHPLDAYAAVLKRERITPSALLADKVLRGDGGVRLAGTIQKIRYGTSQKGNKYAFVALTDKSGQFEVTVFSEVLAISRDMLETGSAVVVTATGRLDGDNVRLTANGFALLDQVAAASAKGLTIRIDDAAALDPLRKLLGPAGRDPGGRGGAVFLTLVGGEREIDLSLPGKFPLSPPMIDQMRTLPGVLEAVEI